MGIDGNRGVCPVPYNKRANHLIGILDMKKILILALGCMLACSCVVYNMTSYVTASIDWCKHNGDTLGHWDNVILSKTIVTSNDDGYTYNATSITTTLIKNGGALDFVTADGNQEMICGGLIHIYNVKDTDIERPMSKEEDKSGTTRDLEDGVQYDTID